ncbi:hypothetical protein AC578_902 [Pseudocercospora eumusae]|uniref:Uncharacterized protein n=1 Tax=Pseudocercospora eumusae TaxID=321146 RepID=A0A139HBX6_9PEZI|nr:hypothetical protein AC578_902 [Pseudocercospora eumusae]
MRFSTLATLFAFMAGALAQSWNCDKSEGYCIEGDNISRLRCTSQRPCRVQGNGCRPVDTNNDGRFDAANCS